MSVRLPLVLRLALRDMRGGLRGFGIFLACIALGVAAIAGVGSVARSLSEGLAREGRTILGGDVAVTLTQREATGEELAFLRAQGALSHVTDFRAMAVAPDGEAALVEVKAVDDAYPLVGTLDTAPAADGDAPFAGEGERFGAVADPALLARLGLGVGDVLRLGNLDLVIKAELVSEPDKIATGVGFGPRLMISHEALARTGLVQPGSIISHVYRLVLPGGELDDAALARFTARAGDAFPDEGWRIRDRREAAPQLQRRIDQFTQYLTLVGMTALLVGGVGVANAVRGFTDRRRTTMATLKAVGASGGVAVAVALTEVMMIAAIGIVIGLVVGALMPFIVVWVAQDVLPLPIVPRLAPLELLAAALYGALAALAFSLGPVGRVHDVPVAALFRDHVDAAQARPRLRYRLAAAGAGVLLIVVALALAHNVRVAAIFLVAAAIAFGLLRLVAIGTMRAARALPHTANPTWRLALANLHRPGTLTPALVLSLGLGVTLVVTLVLVDAGLRRELTRSLPERAPAFFFLDVQAQEADAFAQYLDGAVPGSTIERVPMMRGRIISLKGIRAQDYTSPEEVAWVLEGDRGITFADTPPEGSNILAGDWWPADYDGPPLVSFDAVIAEQLGLGVGDAVVVNVLGREIPVTIANLRSVEWRSLGINFVMVFSPNTFAGAPYTVLATLTEPAGAEAGGNLTLVREIAARFPAVTSVRVRDVLTAVNDMVGQLAVAMAAASAVALIASALVLGGALAASHRARLYDAVILKTLGATRGRLLRAYALEYGLLALVSALFGFLAGSAAAMVIMTQVMRLPADFVPGPAIVAALIAVAVAVTLALAGTWRVLAQRPAAYLRER
ncbi:ABC transporter permease [Pseudochelatococcus contaminans]|uniref:Putative ABC transport system permease protein n=1 Tax=Pseudochelatococcus contaminans TaxID=1538103 RepID=A0A7W5Z2X6_9HYPH|nr:FtsX-like permease family protein [Pseudochelatococcus contaminans]MBB3809038.1 putative ABC transport system permease protein [Pseudochelatococcus contaminans]